MKFSKATDYGLLLLIDLAKLSNGEFTSVRQVARSKGISERFLGSIVRELANAGILSSRRGTNGGIRLAKPSSEISLADVIEALEGPIELFDCQRLPNLCQHEDLCSLRTFWNGLRDELRGSLAGAKIGDFAHIQWVT
ncbi:MAG: Rrf2 family transcriptional regulator [bacterium]